MISAKDKKMLLAVIDYRKRAEAERQAGGYVRINLSLPCVAINCSNGDEYFFQGEEASELIAEARDAFDGGLSITDYILASSLSW